MNEGSGALVFWILIPLFLAVGLYLIWYSRHRKEMLETFSKTHHLSFRPEYKGKLQKTLDQCFRLEGEGLARSFGQLSSLIAGERIFRMRKRIQPTFPALLLSSTFRQIMMSFSSWTNPCRRTRDYPNQNRPILRSSRFRSAYQTTVRRGIHSR